MKRRLLSLVAAFGLIMALAGPAYAYDHTNLAGRIISGGLTGANTSGCMGTIYGMVNNQMVLFTARHCNAEAFNGGWVKAPNGTELGYWSHNATADDGGTCQTCYDNIGQYDMSFIWLDVGQRPYVKNEIYRGDYAVSDHWTNTLGWGASKFSAFNVTSGNVTGNPVYRNQQQTGSGDKPYATGAINGWENYGGDIRTNLVSDNCKQTGIDSGAPFMGYVSTGVYTIVGTGSYAWGTPTCVSDQGVIIPRYNVVANWREAIITLNAWAVNNYPGQGGAYFCSNADCT